MIQLVLFKYFENTINECTNPMTIDFINVPRIYEHQRGRRRGNIKFAFMKTPFQFNNKSMIEQHNLGLIDFGKGEIYFNPFLSSLRWDGGIILAVR